MSKSSRKPPQASKMKNSSTLPSLDYFKTKPLSNFNPSSVNEYFKVEASLPNSEMSSLKSSLRSIKEMEKKENNDLIHFLATTTPQVIIQNISDYIRFFCLYHKKRYYFKDIERLFHSPVFTDFNSEETKYAKGLMQSFEFMFKMGRLQPSRWFSLLVSNKGTNNRTMNINTFIGGVNQLCDELKLPHWLADDLMKLFGYISNYVYVRRDVAPPTDDSSTGKKSVGFDMPPQQFYSNNSYIRRIDLLVAFKKYHASSKKIEVLNRTASVIVRLNEFLILKSMHLRDLLIHTSASHEHNKQHQLFEMQQMLEEGFDENSLSSLSGNNYMDKYNSVSAIHRNTKYITMEECETMISILLSDFSTLYNKNNPNHVVAPSKKPLSVKIMVDHENDSTVSDLSLSSLAGGKVVLPGHMKHGIPRRLITNSFLYDATKPDRPAQRQAHDYYTRSHANDKLAPLSDVVTRGKEESSDYIHDHFGSRRNLSINISDSPTQNGSHPSAGAATPMASPPKLGTLNLAGFGKSFRNRLHPSPTRESMGSSGGGGGGVPAADSTDDSEYTYSDEDEGEFGHFSTVASSAGSFRNGSVPSLGPLHVHKKYHFDVEPHHLNLNSSKNFNHDKINPKLILKNDPNIVYYQSVLENFDRRIGIARKKLDKLK